jgi:hypothetical protein
LNQTSLPRLLYPKRIDRRLHTDRLVSLSESHCKQFSLPCSESDIFSMLWVGVGVIRVMIDPNRACLRPARHMPHGCPSLVWNVTNPASRNYHTSKSPYLSTYISKRSTKNDTERLNDQPPAEVVLGLEPRFPVFWNRHDKMSVSKTNVLTTTLYNR